MMTSSSPDHQVQSFGSSHYSALSFPVKLYTLLNDADQQGFDDVVCWQQGGTSFKVLKPERFAADIMKNYFQQTKYKSFQRQINTYGFRRIHHGPLKGGYSHPMFTRANPNFHMARKHKQPKSDVTKKSLSNDCMFSTLPSNSLMASIFTEEDETNSDFYLPTSFGDDDGELSLLAMNEILSDFLSSNADLSLYDELETSIDDHDDESSLGETTSAASSTNTTYSGTADQWCAHVQEPEPRPNLINHNSMQHQHNTYNHAGDGDDSGESDRYFPCKLYIMLEDATKENFSDIVSWVEGGTAFKVHKRKEFVTTVMPNYFDQTQFESFRRQLNMYGFSRVNKGKDRGVVSHQYLVSGQRSLCHQIKRVSNINKPITR